MICLDHSILRYFQLLQNTNQYKFKFNQRIVMRINNYNIKCNDA